MPQVTLWKVCKHRYEIKESGMSKKKKKNRRKNERKKGIVRKRKEEEKVIGLCILSFVATDSIPYPLRFNRMLPDQQFGRAMSLINQHLVRAAHGVTYAFYNCHRCVFHTCAISVSNVSPSCPGQECQTSSRASFHTKRLP